MSQTQGDTLYAVTKMNKTCSLSLGRSQSEMALYSINLVKFDLHRILFPILNPGQGSTQEKWIVIWNVEAKPRLLFSNVGLR